MSVCFRKKLATSVEALWAPENLTYSTKETENKKDILLSFLNN